MDLSIISYPHPTLRFKSKPIKRVDQALKDIAHQMVELMYEADGVGLAANQVNLPLRMFVVNDTGKRGEGEELILINPELQLPRGGNHSMEEGCLSLPGVGGEVVRPKCITLSAYDINGKPVEREVDGFLSRVLQHENDHLDGIMFFDRMTDGARHDIEGQLNVLETDFKSKQKTGSIESDEALVKGLNIWLEKYT